MPAKAVFTEAEITECLMAVVSWAGNCAAAHRTLQAKEAHCPSASTLNNWVKETHAAKYDELREKYAEQLERNLANEYRENARRALEVQRLAMEKAHDALEGDSDRDPGRTAANMATVADKNTGKLLALTGRPTSIREDRNLEEILRSLVARKVISLPEEEPPQIEGGGE